jgi:hypothetical protein
MEFETSVIYEDCIYIVHVNAINEQLFEVTTRNIVGQQDFILPTILRLEKKGALMECDSFSHPIVDKLIDAIKHYIKRNNSTGPYKKAI